MSTIQASNKPSKLLQLTNIIALAAALIFAYLYFTASWRSGNDCETCQSTDYATNFTGLNAILAKDMVRNYRNNHLQHVQNHMTMGDGSQGGNGDARSVWFSMNTIKKFIHSIEKTVCDTCPGNNTLGIRIYYAEYPNNEDWNTYKNNSVALDEMADMNMYGYHTVMLVPTFRQGGIDVDFDPRHWSNSCQPKPMDAVYNSIVKNDTTFVNPTNTTLYVLLGGDDPENTGESPNGSMQNHGALIPPPYNAPASAGAGFMSLVDLYQ